MKIQLFKRHPILTFSCMLATAALVGCSVVTLVKETTAKEKAANAIGEADADELGRCVGISITSEYPPIKDEKLVKYVNLVGFTLVQSSEKPDQHFCFGVLDTDDIGAYSGPNGYVMITRGALQSMRNEAELAGVLAHEITHVIAGHGIDSARIAARKQGYTDAVDSVLHTDLATKIASIGVDAITVNGYDKKQEDAADAGAVTLMVAAGYDPHAYAHYLSHLAAMQQAAPTTNQAGEVESTYKKVMASHPGIPGRYTLVSEQIKTMAPGQGARLPERFRTYVAQ